MPFGEVEDPSQENRELTLQNAFDAFSELMRKWNIDLTEQEELKVKNNFISNEWKLDSNPSTNTINVG